MSNGTPSSQTRLLPFYSLKEDRRCNVITDTRHTQITIIVQSKHISGSETCADWLTVNLEDFRGKRSTDTGFSCSVLQKSKEQLVTNRLRLSDKFYTYVMDLAVFQFNNLCAIGQKSYRLKQLQRGAKNKTGKCSWSASKVNMNTGRSLNNKAYLKLFVVFCSLQTFLAAFKINTWATKSRNERLGINSATSNDCISRDVLHVCNFNHKVPHKLLLLFCFSLVTYLTSKIYSSDWKNCRALCSCCT